MDIAVSLIIGISSVSVGIISALAVRFGARLEHKQRTNAEAFDEIVTLNEMYRAEIERLRAIVRDFEARQ